MNLCHPLERAVAERGEAVAIQYAAGQITYKLLQEAVQRLARGLQRCGVERGDRVAVMLPNVPHFVISYYAILRLGAVVVPVEPTTKGHELALLMEDCEASCIILWGGLFDHLQLHLRQLSTLKTVIVLGEEPPAGTVSLVKLIARSQPSTEIAEVDSDDPAVIQYSSGPTGRPKGAELTHGNLVSNAIACREIMAMGKEDVLLAALPLSHSLGQTLLMNAAVGAGATLKLHAKFEIEEVSLDLTNGSCSIFVGFPTMFRQLCSYLEDDQPQNPKPPRLSVCGGGSIEEDFLKDFERKFGSYILECYAMAETGPVCSFNQWRSGRRVGSLGHPLPGVEMRIMDAKGGEASLGEVGEIQVKGVNVMRGYIGRPKLNTAKFRDGWFLTGDQGRMDINGFFYYAGCSDGRIIRAGYSIYPAEIMETLLGHPEVENVAVVAVEAPIIGMDIKACVVLKPKATVTTDQLNVYCKERLADYKIPGLIRFYRDLPRKSDGSLDLAELIA